MATIFSVFSNSAESASAEALRRFERKKRMVPASPLASTKFRIRLSVSMIQGMYLWMERSRMR